MHALLAQLASVAGETQANAERAVETLGAHPEVEIAVFPELFLGDYDLALVPQSARAPDCPELGAIAHAAAAVSTAVVVGFAERAEDGTLFNSVACIDSDGSLAGVYRKTRLFGAEPDVFEPGDTLDVVRLAGLDVGPMICFDIEFPEPARVLAAAGAELLVTASANMAPFGPDHERATRERAVENHVPHLYANGIGEIGGFQLVGGSRSVEASGAVLADAGFAQENLLVVPVAER